MVSWVAGNVNTLSGYDPATKGTLKGLYVFATNGQAIDVNAITRLGRNAVENPPAGSPKGLHISAQVIWTEEDLLIPISGGSVLGGYGGLSICFVPASSLGPTPTPQQIYNASRAPGGRILRIANRHSNPAMWTYNWDIWPQSIPLDPDTKYWVLLLPTMAPPGTPPESAGLPRGYTVNGIGRALSFWTNRRPTKPVITAPTNALTLDPGATFNFAYQHNDPDALLPDDPQRLNKDLAAVAVMYSALPTTENPNPEWQLLPYTLPNGTKGFGSYARQRTIPSSYYDPALITNLGFPIKVGTNDPPPGHAGLPSGKWRIRVATGSYATPYPRAISSSDDFDVPWDLINGDPGVIFSDTIEVTVASRVPAPKVLSPANALALPIDRPINLRWKYRNTNLPPLPQAMREVQVRKAGAGDWTTAVLDFSSSPSTTVGAPVSGNPNVFVDLCNGLSGWSGTASGSSAAEMVNGMVTMRRKSPLWPGPPDPTRTGPVYLTRSNIAGVNRVSRTRLKGRRLMAEYPQAGREYSIEVEFYLGNTRVPAVRESQTGMENDWSETGGTLWEASYIVSGEYNTIKFILYGLDELPLELGVDEVRVDLLASGYEFEVSTEYEWRVRAGDSGGEVSAFSAPGRFWVVPAPASGDVRPVPTETLPGATLGCGRHRVFVYRRGGLRRVGEITGLASVEWGRMRDDISTAKITVTDWSLDCGNLLASLQTWAYELVIFRDNGHGVERVWEGPLTLLTYKRDEVVLHAKDVLGYAYRRILRQAMNDLQNPRTITARAEQIIQNAFAPDDPNVLANLQILRREDDVLQYRNTPEYSRTAFEELDDMASNAGLDYTVLGRAILVWGTRHRIGKLPEFRDENLGAPPIVSEYGMSMANRYVVSDGNGIWGDATRDLDPVSGNNERYGLVEMLSSSWASDEEAMDGTLTDEAREKIVQSFKASSERSIGDRYPAPVVVRIPDNTTIHPDTAISIQQLVPGVAIPLRSTGTLRSVVGTQKLDSLSVIETEGGETVTITMSPFNRDDASMDEETEE